MGFHSKFRTFMAALGHVFSFWKGSSTSTHTYDLEKLAGHYPMRQKLKKPRGYKPCASYGFRGAPRVYHKIGTCPAPTIDQVREWERTYGVKLTVRSGQAFNARTGARFFRQIPFYQEQGVAA